MPQMAPYLVGFVLFIAVFVAGILMWSEGLGLFSGVKKGG